MTKELAVKWKESLLEGELATATVTAFFRFAGWEDCQLKALRLQWRVFRDHGQDLTREEYEKLIQAAYAKGDE